EDPAGRHRKGSSHARGRSLTRLRSCHQTLSEGLRQSALGGENARREPPECLFRHLVREVRRAPEGLVPPNKTFLRGEAKGRGTPVGRSPCRRRSRVKGTFYGPGGRIHGCGKEPCILRRSQWFPSLGL